MDPDDKPPADDFATHETLAGDTQSLPAVSESDSSFPVEDWDRYEFLSVLGQGGMGVVFKARDRRLGRIVALKFIRSSDPEMVSRFQREARAQARIDHPAICKVFEVGEVEGKAYIAMQFVDGKSLEDAFARLSLPQKVQLIRDSAEAIHEAHRSGIIHRDIKPANIMVEQSPDGRLRPVVMDFGIAREGTQNSGLTEAGMVMGTPNYMAPEQASGAVEQIDRRSDVYSLGATLYELLTDRPPFVGTSVVDVLFRVLRDDPPPPRQLVRSVPEDLETITLKCLAKEQSLRYDSAKALAEDLQRYIDGEPIIARKASLWYRASKQIRKYKSLYALSLLSLLFIGVLVVDRVRSNLAQARQARIVKEQIERARLLGQDAKEIEWFLRAVYELPLHDVTYAQGIIRARMQQIEQQIPSLGRGGGQLAHYALGRGYLALHETDAAYTHLQAAWDSGPHSPELHYALGRVLGDRFFETLRADQRRGDVEWLHERRQTLDRELLQPAMVHLEASRGVKLESAEFLEGLLALYRGDYDKALLYADRTLKLSPWLYEARKLKGDVLQARALVRLLAKENQRADADLVDAIAMYDDAAEVGRSDIAVFEARAEAWGQLLAQRYEARQSIASVFSTAVTACKRAITIAPNHVLSHRELAGIYLSMAQHQFDSGQDPRANLQALVEVATQGLKLGKVDAGLENALGGGLLMRLFYEQAHALPFSVGVEEIITHQQRAILANPTYRWAYNDMAGAYLFRGNLKLGDGQDPREDYAAAIRYIEQALQHSPNYAIALSNLAYFYGLVAQYAMEHGQPVEESLSAGIRHGEDCQRRKPTLSDCDSNLALLQLTRARSLLHDPKRSTDFLKAVTAALLHLNRAEEHGDKSLELQQSRSRAYLTLAQHQQERGQDASEAIAKTRSSLVACRALSADDPLCGLLSAELALLTVQARSLRGDEAAKLWKEALRAAEAVTKSTPVSAAAYRVLGETHLARAQAALEAGDSGLAAQEVDEGRAAIADCLKRNPTLPRARAVLSALRNLPL
ncbi:MAG: protein kinase [Myxococcales bacterium]|nr:protein kinase [Myxococcales bacterium]